MPVNDEQWMRRCIALARKGAGFVAPNPMVGAVLVHQDQIIGEGWHQQFGHAHAEPNCIHSVSPEKAHMISQSTLYVSLEPCSHFGKTPPCADLIIRHGIRRVVIGCRDTFSKVSGRGIQKLQAAGIEVKVGVEETACRQLNRRFFCFYEQQRPYVILKWAESADRYIGQNEGHSIRISNAAAHFYTQWQRMHESAILVGAQTALNDNPRLSNRLLPHPQPIRIVIDKKANLPGGLHLFDQTQDTLIINTQEINKTSGRNQWISIPRDGDFISDILAALYRQHIQSVIVEGGAQTLQSFISSGLWDEAFIFKAPLLLHKGVKSPEIVHGSLQTITGIEDNSLEHWLRLKQTK